jgi:hypothetical protein
MVVHPWCHMVQKFTRHSASSFATFIISSPFLLMPHHCHLSLLIAVIVQSSSLLWLIVVYWPSPVASSIQHFLSPTLLQHCSSSPPHLPNLQVANVDCLPYQTPLLILSSLVVVSSSSPVVLVLLNSISQIYEALMNDITVLPHDDRLPT